MMLSIRICTIAAIASVALADKHAATTAAGGTTAGVKSPSLVTDDGHLILKTGKGKKVGYTLGGKNRFFAEMDKELADVTDTLEELAGTAADTAEIRTGFDIGYRAGRVDGHVANNSHSYNASADRARPAAPTDTRRVHDASCTCTCAACPTCMLSTCRRTSACA